LITDAGEIDYERRDRRFGIHERLELCNDSPLAYSIGSDFCDAARRSLGAGCFEVDDDEICFLQEALFTIFTKQFDGSVAYTKTIIVPDKFGYYKAGKVGFKV
jgi:hypothetical protein